MENQEAKVPVSVADMDDIVSRIAALRSEKGAKKLALDEVNTELDALELKAMEMLKDSGIPNFRGKDGLITVSHRTSVRVPQGEERLSFFNYLKERGIFDSMITVNSQTLNAFYKSEFELAQERGDDDFTIPGISGETIVESLSFRSK